MDHALPWLISFAPLAYIAAALLPHQRQHPRRFADKAILTSYCVLLIAAATAAAATLHGPLKSVTLGYAGIGFSIYVDALSSVMLVLVSFTGVVVVRYSRNYLDGDPGQIRFTRWLCLTLASVLGFVIAGNMALLVVAWIATSLALNQLLLFYPERPAAQRAALKKFIFSRGGDVSLIAAAGLLYAQFGTLDIAAMKEGANTLFGSAPPHAPLPTAAALLIATTALLKSAQFPFHGWLIEVMETPTPVSALLHAGVINAGGFLVLRLADVMTLSPAALHVLALVGGATALFGSLVMLTQTSVKVQLAYSTVAQMGFMLLQCGLGVFPAALLHIVAHSLYKAHAFLSSGSILDLARASWSPSPSGQPHPARLVIALIVVTSAALVVGAIFGFTPERQPSQIALSIILLIGLVHYLASAIDERFNSYVLGRTALTAIGLAAIYFALQIGAAHITAGSLPLHEPASAVFDGIIAGLAVISFAALTLFQNQMVRNASRPEYSAAYVHLKHGLYVNTLANRLIAPLMRPRGFTPAA